MAFTLNSLKQAIQDYTENTEPAFVNNLPLFIRAAEERILKNVQLSLFMRNLQGTMTTGNQYVACPTDFLAPYSISIEVPTSSTPPSTEKYFIEFKDMSFVQEYNPDVTVLGKPVYYAQFDVGNFTVAPTPDADYDFEIQYLYRPASLTGVANPATDTTWLSTNADLSMLYGSLVEAYIFMKGEQDMMAMYDKRFAESLQGLKMLGEAKETTQNYRVGQVIRNKQ